MTLYDAITLIKLPFLADRELYRSLHRILGFWPRHIAPYQQALVHKSVQLRSAKGKSVNNERLEFLGDAILGAVVADIVYSHFPGRHEGFLTNTRSKLVQRESLNKIAQEIGLDKLVKADPHICNAHNCHLPGNAFEALVGAIYLDRGYRHCMAFIEKQILSKLVNIDKLAYREQNFKSRLIEWAQKHKLTATFNVEETPSGRGKAPTFTATVTIEGVHMGTGKGYSKKESHQVAARQALWRLKHDEGIRPLIEAAREGRHK